MLAVVLQLVARLLAVVLQACNSPATRLLAVVLQRVAGLQLACYTPASSRVSREVLATRLQKHPPLRNYHKFSQGILKMFSPSLFPLAFLFFFPFFYICSSSDGCIFFLHFFFCKVTREAVRSRTAHQRL